MAEHDSKDESATVLLEDPEHGFAEGEWENNRWVRCPDGCEIVWDKNHDAFQRFAAHMDDHLD